MKKRFIQVSTSDDIEEALKEIRNELTPLLETGNYTDACEIYITIEVQDQK